MHTWKRWACLVLMCVCGAGHASVLKKTLWTRDALIQVAPNGDLETVEGARFPWWGGYHKGHDIDDGVRHGGRFSARCTNTAPGEIRGLGCQVEVNQKVPTPFVAVGWSKAENIARPAGGTDGYWLWPGGVYTDGTDMAAHPAPFKYGTHGWQRCTVTMVPRKPLKTMAIGGFLRNCTGTAWFDDFELWSLDIPAGTPVFDGYPVAPQPSPPTPHPGLSLRTDDGFSLQFDTNTSHVCTQLPGGLFVRDDEGMSDFIQPEGQLTREQDGSLVFAGEDQGLGLALSATYRSIGQAIRIDGTLRDLRQTDRAITLYFSYPVWALGWTWQDDPRTSRRIEEGQKYLNTDDCQVGTNWRASRYPFACLTGPAEQIVLGAPLDVPRLWRFAYDAESKELYAAVDLGLSPDTKRFPCQASFSLVLYHCDPAWGFRSALQRYYELFPDQFVRRAQTEGIWGFNTIPWDKMERPEDFGFQFIQGGQNPWIPAEHGWDLITYCEPMTYWLLSMAPEIPRTEENALQRLETAVSERERQTACITQNENGELHGGPSTYMGNGYLFLVNPSPSFPAQLPNTVPKGYELLRELDSALKVVESPRHRAWENVERVYGDTRVWQDGYSLASGEGRNGSAAMKLVRRDCEDNAVARQVISVKQAEARPLTARVWVKAQDVSGDPDNSFGVVVDALYPDGSYGPGIALKPRTGTHDWELLEQTITPPKPYATLAFHCLLRRPHTGTAWFEDAFLGEPGGANLLKCPDFEPDPTDVKPRLGGLMLDCFLSWCDRNYRREHFAYTDTPLIYDSESRVCEYMLFPEIEFAKAAAQRLWPLGKLMMFAGAHNSCGLGAPWMDVNIDECTWDAGGRFSPEPDSSLMYQRVFSDQRPILFYIYTREAELTPELVELYLKRCTAYAIYPSLAESRSGGKLSDYWWTPELYNRDRPLWRRYIPIIKALAAAGWEPITHARSTNAAVHVERFGRAGGPLFLTVYNDSPQAQTAAVGLDPNGLQLTNSILWDAMTGAQVALETGPLMRMALQPYDVKVLRIDRPE